MWTPQFDDFVAPARRRPQLWRLTLGIVITFAIYVATIALVLLTVFFVAGMDGLNGWMQRIASAETPTAVILMLVTFAGMMIGPLVAAKLLHDRSPRTVFGHNLLPVFGMAAAITAAVFCVAFTLVPAPFDLVPNTPLNLFFSFLPLALAGLLLQTGAEEVLFRGYLQGQLAARFHSPLIWMLLPAIAFGALHYDPTNAGPNAPWIVAAATLFGLIAADLTRVTGSIGAAWGIHFVNNATAILVVALDGTLSGMSLWKTPFSATDTDVLRPLIVQDMLTSVIIWAAIRLWLAKRNGGASTQTG